MSCLMHAREGYVHVMHPHTNHAHIISYANNSDMATAAEDITATSFL
jgi:hypothetical protein